MIKLLRVDHRLLHGQVAFSWTGYLGVNCILIANDEVVKNDIQMTTLRLAKPSNVKLIIKNIDESIAAINTGKTDKYDMFIIVKNVIDAYKIVTQTTQIKTVNIGGLLATKETEPFTGDRNINFTKKEVELLKKLESEGTSVEMRMVPSDTIKKF